MRRSMSLLLLLSLALLTSAVAWSSARDYDPEGVRSVRPYDPLP
jgi:hypothetical protein